MGEVTTSCEYVDWSTQQGKWVRATLLYGVTQDVLDDLEQSPNHLVLIAYVLVVDAANGLLLVSVTCYPHLTELHDVLITTPLDTQILEYEAASGLWKNVMAPSASEAVVGRVEIATQAETDTGTDDSRAVTALKLANASTVIKSGQTAGGDLEGTYPNPTVKAASETVAGKIEIATQAEVTTGTDDSKAITPLKLETRLIFGKDFQQVSDETTTTTTSGTYTSKITLTTGALTGTYRAAFGVEMMGSDKDKQTPCRLYNITDDEVYCLDEGDKEEKNRWDLTGGFVYVTLAGVSKVLAVQFASPEGITVSCRRARIEFWRVA